MEFAHIDISILLLAYSEMMGRCQDHVSVHINVGYISWGEHEQGHEHDISRCTPFVRTLDPKDFMHSFTQVQ